MAPANIIYSTSPRLAFDANGNQFCVKGDDDLQIVLAELIGHMMAGLCGVLVPHYAVGRFVANGPLCFCSQIVGDAIRDVQFHLEKSKVTDFAALSKIILLDIWLANNDRNIGNLLGRSRPDIGSSVVDLVAIDYEKSLVVRSVAPLVEITHKLPIGALWPRGVLGVLCKQRAVLLPTLVDELKSISETQITTVVVKSLVALGAHTTDRAETIVGALLARQSKLGQLAKAEWN